MSERQGLQVVITFDIVPTGGRHADVSARLEVDGEAWMVEAITAANEIERISAAFEVLKQTITSVFGAVVATGPVWATTVRPTEGRA